MLHYSACMWSAWAVSTWNTKVGNKFRHIGCPALKVTGSKMWCNDNFQDGRLLFKQTLGTTGAWCDGLKGLQWGHGLAVGTRGRGAQRGAGGEQPHPPLMASRRGRIKGGLGLSVLPLHLQTLQLLTEAVKSEVCFSWVLAVNTMCSSADYTSVCRANYSTVIKGVRTFWSTFCHLLCA